MIQGLIFDLDGVIVDTARYHYLAWKKLADELDFHFSESQNEALKGVSRMHALEILLQIGGVQASEEKKLDWAERKNVWYRQYLKTLTPNDILPGVLEFLREAKERRYKTALGSASKNARTILDQLEIIDYFDFIADGTMTQKAKPDPEVFLLAAEGILCPPKDCLVFEDALAGVQAARNAGMKVVGICNPSVLEKADMIFPGFKNLHLADLEALCQ